MGGSETDPGIFINWSLKLGTTATRCITFKKFWPISRDLVFDIRTLELWVVNEVLIKRNNHVPRRDFYNTVMMWNRIGKRKSNVEAIDGKRDSEEYWRHGRNQYHHDFTNGRECEEVHETELRRFEASNPSLLADSTDEELLQAIKNRLAGIPITTTSSPAHGGSLFKRNNEFSARKKLSTNQVDESMIPGIRPQCTSTSHVKVGCAYTQSAVGYSMGEKSHLMHIDEEYQDAVTPTGEDHTERNSDTMQRPRQGRSSPIRRVSFPGHSRQEWLPQIPPKSSFFNRCSNHPPPYNGNSNTLQVANGLQDIPGVPELSKVSTEQPSVSKSTIGEASYNQSLHERSWVGRKNDVAVLPFQQQLVCAPPPKPTQNRHQAEFCGISKRNPSPQKMEPSSRQYSYDRERYSNSYQDGRSSINEIQVGLDRSLREPSSNPFQEAMANPHDNTSHRNIQRPSTMTYLYGSEQLPDLLSDPYPRRASQWNGSGFSPLPPPPQPLLSSEQLSPEEAAITVMPLCERCEQLDMFCFCGRQGKMKKDFHKGCHCPEYSKRKKKKRKSNKESKAEGKERKKGEKRRERKGKDEQKDREKEVKKKENKSRKRGKSKRGTKEKSPICSKCGRDMGDTVRAHSETDLTASSDFKIKKTKKEKTDLTDSSDFKIKKAKKEKTDLTGSSDFKIKKAKKEKTDLTDSSDFKIKKDKKEKSSKEKKLKEKNSKDKPKKKKKKKKPEGSDDLALKGRNGEMEFEVANQEMSARGGMRFCGHPEFPCPETVRRSESPLRSPRRSQYPASQRDIVAAPIVIVPSETGNGDSHERILNLGRSSDPGPHWLPFGTKPTPMVLIDVSKKHRKSASNKHYVPPCVLYLDCTKVKDLCLIIKNKYEE